MTSCKTTAVWLGRNNSRSVLVRPTALSRTPAAADHSLSHILPSSPACLWSAGAQLAMISREMDIKSRTVWKDLQDGMERTIRNFCYDHRPGPGTLFPALQFSPPFSISACGTGACSWRCGSSLPWHHTWNDASMEHFSLNRHLMI